MIMRYELIVAGFLLLTCTWALKVVLDLHVLPRLALCLNLFLAVLAAFHFWPVFHGLTSGLSLAWDGFPVDAGSFWVGLLAAALPGWILYRYTIRDALVEFPLVFDRLSGAVCVLGLLWLVSCLTVMSVSIVPATAQNVLPEEGLAGQAVAGMRKGPLQFYLGVATAVGGEHADELLTSRIPVRLRQQVYRRGAGR